MRPADILKYALTIVAIDAAQLLYTKIRERACDRFGIRAGGSTPDITDPVKEAVWREVNEDVDKGKG